MEKEQEKETGFRTAPGLNLTIHLDEMKEISQILNQGMDETEQTAFHLIEAAIEKIRTIGVDTFKCWAEEGESTQHIYNLIVEKFEAAAQLGQQDAVDLLADLDMKPTCH